MMDRNNLMDMEYNVFAPFCRYKFQDNIFQIYIAQHLHNNAPLDIPNNECLVMDVYRLDHKCQEGNLGNNEQIL